MHPMIRKAQPDRLVTFCDGSEALRRRSVAAQVHSTTLEVPTPPERLQADWSRDIDQRLCLEPGDVEQLPLARARMRWPNYKACVQAMAQWTRSLGLQELLADSEVSLMACRGARYHHDGAQYGAMAFCNLFLSEDRGLDLHFPCTGQRIPLVRGTAVLFDTAQAHAVIARHATGFVEADFPAGQDCDQVFLTWELPIENAQLAKLLGIAFDPYPFACTLLTQEQAAPATLCPQTGRWT